jgi:hypothetical protein
MTRKYVQAETLQSFVPTSGNDGAAPSEPDKPTHREASASMFRPYGTTADFSCGDNVICYIGIEQYSVPADHREVTLWHRQTLR